MKLLWLHYAAFAAGVAVAILCLCVEHYRHARRLAAIKTRILVNGIRGKSSITRLVAAALRADTDRVVFAKTTGTAARMIYPAGREVPVRRPRGVNVIEQVAIVGRAAAAGADTLVMECMAVDPLLQALNQDQLVRSQIGVISNVREDHLEEMGPTLTDVARSLANTMPRRGVCFSAETDRELRGVLLEEAGRRGCTLYFVDPDSVTDREMGGFGYLAFKENVALALAVAQWCGVSRRRALRGMWQAAPDPGVLRVEPCMHAARVFDAVNLFAANDPESTMMNLRLLRERGLVGDSVSVVINCRPDRLERNGQMGALIQRIMPDRVFLIGTPTRSALHAIPEDLHQLVVDLDGEHRSGGDLLDAIAAQLPTDRAHAIVLVGNIHGRGEALLEALHEAAAAPDGVDAIEATADLPALRWTHHDDTLLDLSQAVQARTR
jgi:poly-gamma-glutamate synthase PgsB/CapB